MNIQSIQLRLLA